MTKPKIPDTHSITFIIENLLYNFSNIRYMYLPCFEPLISLTTALAVAFKIIQINGRAGNPEFVNLFANLV